MGGAAVAEVSWKPPPPPDFLECCQAEVMSLNTSYQTATTMIAVDRFTLVALALSL
jgi:hypothetical protein